MLPKSKVKPIAKLLDDPNKEVHKTYGSFGALSKLWRIMVRDRNISPYRFGLMMERFLNDPKNRYPNNPKERMNNRGNLNKELSNPAMSWKVFCRKALRFLDLKEIRITVEAVNHDDTYTVHRIGIDLVHDALIDLPELDEGNQLEGAQRKKLPLPQDQEPITFLDDEEDESRDH